MCLGLSVLYAQSASVLYTDIQLTFSATPSLPKPPASVLHFKRIRKPGFRASRSQPEGVSLTLETEPPESHKFPASGKLPKHVKIPINNLLFQSMTERCHSFPHPAGRAMLLADLGCFFDVQSYLGDADGATNYYRSRECFSLSSRQVLTLPPALQRLFAHRISDDRRTMRWQCIRLTSLAVTLICHYLDSSFELQDPNDIDRVIALLESAEGIVWMNCDYLHDVVEFCSALGQAYWLRAEVTGSLVDLDKAVNVVDIHLSYLVDDIDSAIDSEMDASNRYALINYLILRGAAGLRRFQRLRGRQDLDSAFNLLKAALILTQGLNSTWIEELLAQAYLSSYETFNDRKDLEECIRLRDDIIGRLGVSSPGAVIPIPLVLPVDSFFAIHTKVVIRYYATLGFVLSKKAEQGGDLKDCERAVKITKDVVRMTPDALTVKQYYQFYAANALILRYTMRGDKEDLRASSSLLTSIARTISNPPQLRFMAVLLQLDQLFETTWPMLMELLSTAMSILPSVTPLGLPFLHRCFMLTGPFLLGTDILRYVEFPSFAAAYAIENEDHATAIEWLDRGRSILWEQFAQLRAPLRLEGDADDAERLRTLQLELLHDTVLMKLNNSQGKTREELNKQIGELRGSDIDWEHVIHDDEDEGQKLRRHAKLWEGEMARLSTLEDPDSHQPLLHRVAAAGIDGPVVVINIGSNRCDALIILPGCVEDAVHVPLPALTKADVIRMKRNLISLLGDDFSFKTPSRSASVKRVPIRADLDTDPEEEFRELLKELWVKIAEPILHALGFNVSSLRADSEPTTRLYWCPTQQLTLLPLHAAGDYDKPGPGFRVHDFVVCSYAPVLTLCFSPKQRPPFNANLLLRNNTAYSLSPSLLIMVSYPSTPPKKRHQISENTLPHPIANIYISQKRTPLLNASYQRWRRPRRYIQERASPQRNVEAHAQGHDDHFRHSAGKLIVLSACQTAAGDEELPAEALHLAAGMLFAGYRNACRGVADDVYRYMLQSEVAPARALHLAMQKLRAKVGEKEFLQWVPYVHLGV
ncbi:hypothetical protein BDZ89DRAFT_1118048 [Hymenopellis radicata]|nr:hypothetical protein BDZ89DRAFT_1118048 [Hymenopellis radicata]